MAIKTQQLHLTHKLASVLELARWAPSGDNTQPWCFRLVGENMIDVLYRPSESLGVFNLDHFAGHLSMGALLESLDIAASTQGWSMEILPQSGFETANFKIRFHPTNRPLSVLLPYLESRATQRRALSIKLLSKEHKHILEESVGKFYNLIWIEDWPAKIRLARLLGLTAKIRLTTPETYTVHRDTVAWKEKFSPDRIPDSTIAVDPLLLRVMRWAMISQKRVRFLNRFLWGHALPRLEMDIIPAIFCGAHCLLSYNQSTGSTLTRIDAGRAMQKLWLTATSLGLQAQPEMAPVIFSRYVAQNKIFTEDTQAWEQTKLLSQQFIQIFGSYWNQGVCMMRLGKGKSPSTRSLRKSLAELII